MTQVLRGNIVHAPKMGELSILERGYMVLEDGVIRGIYPVLPEELAQAFERLAVVHAADRAAAQSAAQALRDCCRIGGEKPERLPFIKGVVK